MELADARWNIIERHIPAHVRRSDGKGRPRRDAREVMNGIFWILRTGAQCSDMPDRYPPYQNCHRYFQSWCSKRRHGLSSQGSGSGYGGTRRDRFERILH